MTDKPPLCIAGALRMIGKINTMEELLRRADKAAAEKRLDGNEGNTAPRLNEKEK